MRSHESKKLPRTNLQSDSPFSRLPYQVDPPLNIMASFRTSLRDTFRDTAFGQLVRLISKNRLLRYPEEDPDFKLPDTWIRAMNGLDVAAETTIHGSAAEAAPMTPTNRTQEKTPDNEKAQQGQGQSRLTADQDRSPDLIDSASATDVENAEALEKMTSVPVVPKRTKDGIILVDWYHTDDPANPHNWSNRRRNFLALLICLYTFVVYTTSAIYTPSTQGVMEQFQVSSLKASLGLSIYVLGYGVGPLLFSPLSEIPRIGRNPVYIITMFLFVILSIPVAFVDNFAGLIVLRFLQGFFGSPCLASGGASMADMHSMLSLPFAMIAWVAAAYCGRKFALGSCTIPSQKLRPS